MDGLTLYILAVFFVATLVRSTFGFGESLVAVPLLVLVVSIEVAVPLAVLTSILIAAVVVIQDRREVHLHSAKWLVAAAVLGIPVGLLLLVHGNESVVQTILGILLVIYSGYSLISKSTFRLKTDHKAWLFVCGFLSGVSGGAYGLNGPPLVVYGNLRRWPAEQFRATLQAYFLPTSILAIAAYAYQGLWTWEVTRYFLFCLPVVIPAIFLGRYFNSRLKDGAFLKYVHVGLLCMGAVLINRGINMFLEKPK